MKSQDITIKYTGQWYCDTHFPLDVYTWRQYMAPMPHSMGAMVMESWVNELGGAGGNIFHLGF